MKRSKVLLFISFSLSLLIIGIFINNSFSAHEIVKNNASQDFSELKDGDIVFQISESGQGKAVQLATHSKYTHCGIVFRENNQYMVYEAVQPVKKTPMKEWITHGEEQFYTVRRLKTAATVMTPEIIAKMKLKYKQFAGKNYDLYFGWSDEKIYCSELVWKMYKEATGLEVGALQKLKEFDLTHPIVKAKLEERYGNKIPYEENVISPAALFDSELLETVVK
jgi:hypothetical protein